MHHYNFFSYINHSTGYKNQSALEKLAKNKEKLIFLTRKFLLNQKIAIKYLYHSYFIIIARNVNQLAKRCST